MQPLLAGSSVLVLVSLLGCGSSGGGGDAQPGGSGNGAGGGLAGQSAGGGGSTTGGSSGAGGAISSAGAGGGGTAGGAGAPACDEGKPIEVQVRAWGATFTGVYAEAGDTITISATGAWSSKNGDTGPDGMGSGPDDCPAGALVARIGKFHQRTCIRAAGSITAERAGYVWLFQSDGADAMKSKGELAATLSGGHCSTLPREGIHPSGETLTAERRAAFEAVCGPTHVPVLFEAEKPDDPRVKSYVADYMGGDAQAWLSDMVVNTCALFYATPADYTKAFGDRRMRIVHYIYDSTKWEELGRPPYRDASGEYVDFVLQNPLAELQESQPDYGPMGGIPVSINHEAGHVISPDGGSGTLPKWLQETYAELAPSNRWFPSTFYHAIDNPESSRFGGRSWWCDGTFGGPTFVAWIDTQYPDFLHRLTAASLALGENGTWPGSNAVFQPITGKTFDELWQAYAAAYAFEEPKPLEECLDPRE